MTTRSKNPAIDNIGYHLSVTLRMLAFSLALPLFAALGLMDAGIRLLWPAWRSRASVPRWVSAGFVGLLERLFPHILVVPCGWRRQYRVLRLNYPQRCCPGQSAQVEIDIQNASKETWHNETFHPCRLGVIHPPDGSAFYMPDEWLNPTRPAELPAEIGPSMTVSLRVPITAPHTPGLYRETWGLVIEGHNWLPTLHALDIQIEVKQEG